MRIITDIKKLDLYALQTRLNELTLQYERRITRKEYFEMLLENDLRKPSTKSKKSK
jgi:hypothetical protein